MLFNAVLITDIIVIILLLIGVINSKTLVAWYKELNLSAVICDVLVIFLVIVLTRFLYKYIFGKFVLWKFILLAVFLQIIHDLSFYKFILSVPRGKSLIVDLFKNYGGEGGFLTVYPCASGRPDASNLNFVSGQIVPNLVIAPVDVNGNICFYSYGKTHLLADVSGYFP